MKTGAKRRFGQHFLEDTGVLDRIVCCLAPSAEDVFLEIGAGRGALSGRLAERVRRLIALEIDSDCLPILGERLAQHPSAVIELGDILEVDLEALVLPHLESGSTLRVAGNLPYNIATAIIERLLYSSLHLHDLHFLVQLEMAQRIIAIPGTRAYGYYSVLCQHRAEASLSFRIGSGSFRPRPKVVSAMIALKPRRRSSDTEADMAFIRVVKAAFGHRRKVIVNSLRRSPLHADWDSLLDRAGIDGRRRPEEVSVQEYECLARHYGDR